MKKFIVAYESGGEAYFALVPADSSEQAATKLADKKEGSYRFGKVIGVAHTSPYPDDYFDGYLMIPARPVPVQPAVKYKVSGPAIDIV